MAALMPVFITERYRLAAAPGLLLLAAGGLWLLWENLTARSWDKVALQVVLTAACAWFVSQPQPDIGLWSLDFYKAGIRATDGRNEAIAQDDPKLAAAHLASARRNLETAYAYVPANADITFALGNVWYYNHDNARAKLCFERANQLATAGGRPHDGALNNLGVIALTEKRPKDAEILFQLSIKTEPEDAKTWFLLAEACRDQGDIPHAEIAIAQAIKLNGKDASFQKFRDDLRKPAPAPAPVPK
jgi:tetratricopeptide (TPR) repeat protein